MQLRGRPGGLGAPAINESYWRTKDHMLHSRIHFDRGRLRCRQRGGLHQGFGHYRTCMPVALTGTGSGLRTTTLPRSPVSILNEIAAPGMDFAFSPDQS
jgi:hypothetical protein